MKNKLRRLLNTYSDMFQAPQYFKPRNTSTTTASTNLVFRKCYAICAKWPQLGDQAKSIDVRLMKLIFNVRNQNLETSMSSEWGRVQYTSGDLTWSQAWVQDIYGIFPCLFGLREIYRLLFIRVVTVGNCSPRSTVCTELVR